MSGETCLTHLSRIQLSWVKWELMTGLGLQCAVSATAFFCQIWYTSVADSKFLLGFGFRATTFLGGIRIRILQTYLLGQNHSKVFFQWPTNIFWIQYYEKKLCYYENICFFSCYFNICHALLVLNYSVWIGIRIWIQIRIFIWIRIWQKVLDSFGFGSATLRYTVCLDFCFILCFLCRNY
jgi:hypothetical protein